MYYSKVTKKGQMTVPVKFRAKYSLKEGATVTFKETDEGLLLTPAPDIADSAGALSSYAESRDVLSDLLKIRERSFR